VRVDSDLSKSGVSGNREAQVEIRGISMGAIGAVRLGLAMRSPWLMVYDLDRQAN
jgi:hypothetical protein